MKSGLRNRFFLSLGTTAYILCIIAINFFNSMSKSGRVIAIGSFQLPAASILGILITFQTIIAVLLILVNYRQGIIIVISLLAFSFVSALIPIIRYSNLSSLPGITNVILNATLAVILYYFYRRTSENSFTDYLTGLGNRRSYVRHIHEQLSQGKPFYVTCIEIQDFKHINNTFGIQEGDSIIRQISARMKKLLTPDDTLFIITGATFAVISRNIASSQEAQEKFEQIIKPMSLHLSAKNYDTQDENSMCTVSLSAGMVYIDSPKTIKKTATAIFKDAETAMLVTQKNDNRKVFIYDSTMEDAEEKLKEAEFLIRESLEKDLFYLVYQPQYTAEGKKLRGFETLIRCRKTDGTIVSPAFFIPAAEKTNLITKIDAYVLRRAMCEFKPLLNAMKKPCILSVNVSAKTIAGRKFAGRIRELLEETGFPPESLEIEITEYSFADSMETTIGNILVLRDLGVQIALDDFGTGYTSIAQLMKLPVNLLKIDKSLIDDIETKQTMRDMVDSVIYMGHLMNCEVISEGVETENQLTLLRQHKCDFIQGFIWGKPQEFSDAKQICLAQ